jgi:UPF0755 protein
LGVVADRSQMSRKCGIVVFSLLYVSAAFVADTASEQRAAKPADTASEQQAAKPADTTSEQRAAKPTDTASEQQAAKSADTTSEQRAAKPVAKIAKKKSLCPICFQGETVNSELCASVCIDRGLGVLDIARLLYEKGLIASRFFFVLLAFCRGKCWSLKAGEYWISRKSTLGRIVDMLADGEVVLHRIQIPEGVTARVVANIVNAHHHLVGEPVLSIAEGGILPGTIFFSGQKTTRSWITAMLGKKREELLDQCYDAISTENRQMSREEIIILASIVEKETSLAKERPLIARVFLNRLDLGMPLQADPTIIYAIELETGRPLGRPLCKADLAYNSEYNTYRHKGLPPKPICCPGEASIKAVFEALKAGKSKLLYFVAAQDGKGHIFSSSNEQHNKNRQTHIKRN